VAKRLTIPQILAHPWFTTRKPTYEQESPLQLFTAHRSSTPDHESRRNSEGTSEASTQESVSPLMRQPDLVSSTPTTPDESVVDPFESTDNKTSTIQRQMSNSTIRKMSGSDLESLPFKLAIQPTVMEEGDMSPPPLSSKAPPSHPLRTPARTKRRSVSSIMSDSGSPTIDKTPTPLPTPTSRDLDFVTMLTANTPVMFSTPTERHLLNTLSSLGFDTAQIVHSVLSHACDSAGAVWWMLLKKEDKMVVEDAEPIASAAGIESVPLLGDDLPKPKKKRTKLSAGVQTEYPYGTPPPSLQSIIAPQFALVPPTPTFVRPSTPPRSTTPTRSPLLSPSSSTITGEMSSIRSHPTTPSGSLKDKDKDKDMGSKGRKARAGSVSIMQRATTALEAAGLVRKKSSEAVREDKERDREREKSREGDRRVPSNEEPRASHGSGSSKLTKSPPMKPSKDQVPPSTPPPHEQTHGGTQIGSPWVLAETREAMGQTVQSPPGSAPVSAANLRGEMLHSHSTPNFSETAPSKAATSAKTGVAPHRNKANLLTAFRLWFNEDRKGKRKESDAAASNAGSPHGNYTRMSTGRRGSGSNGKFGRASNHRGQRPSMNSRRSSSVNSKRSSGASMQVVLDSPQIPTRRSFGSHTPNSEFGGEHSSRPSSIRSFSMHPRHRKSPSQSSAGSIHLRTSSPMQKYHRRAGSGSSTRVVRQMGSAGRPPHHRSNSATSSIHSPPSSRPTSYYEPSENEGIPRTTSPLKSRSRRSTDDSSRRGSSSGNSTFVAQKRQGPFASPAYGNGGTAGRSSWKKSWGIEPPGWSSRTAHLPIEVLAISPANEPISIRDVFSGKQAHGSPGDESDWVDEDDDIPAFAGGLGQLGTSAASTSGAALPAPSSYQMQMEPTPVTLSPAPRGHRSKRNNNRSGSSSSAGGSGPAMRSKQGHSPAERSTPLPAETGYDSGDTRSGRRQLPAGRSGPAFKHPIQEEDEEEEEE